MSIVGAGMSLGAVLSKAATRVTSKAAAWELKARARKVRVDPSDSLAKLIRDDKLSAPVMVGDELKGISSERVRENFARFRGI